MAYKDKARQREWSRANYIANREEIKTKSRAYYAANREKCLERQKEYYSLHFSGIRNRKLADVYGIDPSRLELMQEIAGGRCAICGQEEELKVDHDHATGRIRGLLCNLCNSALGFLKDDPDIVMQAKLYLETM